MAHPLKYRSATATSLDCNPGNRINKPPDGRALFSLILTVYDGIARGDWLQGD